MGMRNLVPWVGLVLLLGCGGGGGKPQPAPLGPPTQVQAVPYSAYGFFKVTWVAPSADVTGYDLEANLNSSGFQKARNTIGGTTVIVGFSESTPELTPISMRLRALRGAESSAYSNEASTRFPIKPAVFIYAYFDYDTSRMTVEWDKASQVATTVKVDRAQLTGTDPGPFTNLYEGPASTRSLSDADLQEGVAYRYRVSFLAQGEQSDYKYRDSEPVFLAPQITSTHVSAGATTLGWQKAGPTVVELKVQRSERLYEPIYTTLASLPTEATTYVDNVSGNQHYAYRILVRSATQTSYSKPVRVLPLPSGTGVAVTPFLAKLPSPVIGLQKHDVAFAYVTSGSTDRAYEVTPPPGASWPAHTIQNVNAIDESGFALDGVGHPHLLFRRRFPDPSLLQAVMHEWYDGKTWQSEELFRSEFHDNSATVGIQFALTPDGIVHASWHVPDVGWGDAVLYGTNRTGTWESTKIWPSAGNFHFGSYRLAVDPQGGAYVAIGLYDKVLLFSRPVGVPTFSQEVIPTGEFEVGEYAALLLQPYGEGLALFYERPGVQAEVGLQQMYVTKRQGVWSEPSKIVTRPSSGVHTVRKAASSTNGRLFYAVDMPEGVRIFSRQPNQTWDSTLLPPSWNNSPIKIGFSALNKFWCLLDLGYSDQHGFHFYGWYSE